MASTYLTYTQQSPSTAEGQKFTLSMWVKKSVNGTTSGLYGNTYSNTHRGYIYFNAQDTLQYYDSAGVNYTTTRVFRDNNAFYHIVIAVDTTLSSSSDRIKFYVNGVRETSFSASSAPNQNDTLKLMNTTLTPNMGRIVEAGTSYYLQGVISHAHLTQGYTYDATPFGETDSTTGEWKIKTSVTGVNYGTNGFWWLKDSIATTDHSPNSNTFTVASGTLTKTEDSPSNVFATWNPLYRTSATSFAYGNTESQSPSTGGFAGISTLGASSGKYYAEFKLQAASTSYEACIAVMVGSSISGNDLPSGYPEYTVGSYGIRQGDASSGNAFWTTGAGGRTSGSHHGGFSIGDTIGIALDIDNNRVYFSKGGQWNNSGSWNSATPSTYLTLISTYGDGQYLFVSGDSSGGNTAKWSANFGNGYQQSTAVSSAGTNASGNGIFEYDVPTGYTALSTKGLNL